LQGPCVYSETDSPEDIGYRLKTLAQADGSYILVIKVRDRAGNERVSAPYEIYVANQEGWTVMWFSLFSAVVMVFVVDYYAARHILLHLDWERAAEWIDARVLARLPPLWRPGSRR
jgi:hypothetical protein